MAPFDQRADCGPLATAAFEASDKLQQQSHAGKQEYELDSESTSTKEVKLLFGCLDLDFCWNPCPASDSTVNTKCSDNDNMDAHSDTATELCKIETPPVTPVSTTFRSAVDEQCLPSSQSIILQSIISYSSSENETNNPLIPAWHTQESSSQSLDEFLSSSQNSADSGGGCVEGDDDNESELSFSYSSFSESDSAAHLEEMDDTEIDEDDIHETCSASSGDDSVLSFDASDFLEDDDESSSIRNGTCTVTGAPQMKRLGTIMECYEEFSSSTLGSDRTNKTIIPKQLWR